MTSLIAIAFCLSYQPAAQPNTPSAPAAPAATPQPKPVEAPSASESSIFESAAPEVVASGLKFAEGPMYKADGTFICCDIQGDAVYSMKPGDGAKDRKPGAGVETVKAPAGRPAGSALDAKGRLVLARFDGSVARLSEKGELEVLADTFNGHKLNMPNDLIVAPDGSVIFTDFGKGDGDKNVGHFGVYRIDLSGDKPSLSLLTKDVSSPNGLALSNDGKTLYVAEYGAGTVKSFEVGEKWSVSGGKTLINLNAQKAEGKRSSTPDGLKVDAAGNIWTTGMGGIVVIAPEGKVIASLKLAGASNFCFGGTDGKTVFITAGKAIHSAKLKVAAIDPKKLPGAAK